MGDWADKVGNTTCTGPCGFSVFPRPLCEGSVQGYGSGPEHQCCHWELQRGKVCNMP